MNIFKMINMAFSSDEKDTNNKDPIKYKNSQNNYNHSLRPNYLSEYQPEYNRSNFKSATSKTFFLSIPPVEQFTSFNSSSNSTSEATETTSKVGASNTDNKSTEEFISRNRTSSYINERPLEEATTPKDHVKKTSELVDKAKSKDDLDNISETTEATSKSSLDDFSKKPTETNNSKDMVDEISELVATNSKDDANISETTKVVSNNSISDGNKNSADKKPIEASQPKESVSEISKMQTETKPKMGASNIDEQSVEVNKSTDNVDDVSEKATTEIKPKNSLDEISKMPTETKSKIIIYDTRKKQLAKKLKESADHIKKTRAEFKTKYSISDDIDDKSIETVKPKEGAEPISETIKEISKTSVEDINEKPTESKPKVDASDISELVKTNSKDYLDNISETTEIVSKTSVDDISKKPTETKSNVRAEKISNEPVETKSKVNTDNISGLLAEVMSKDNANDIGEVFVNAISKASDIKLKKAEAKSRAALKHFNCYFTNQGYKQFMNLSKNIEKRILHLLPYINKNNSTLISSNIRYFVFGKFRIVFTFKNKEMIVLNINTY